MKIWRYLKFHEVSPAKKQRLSKKKRSPSATVWPRPLGDVANHVLVLNRSGWSDHLGREGLLGNALADTVNTRWKRFPGKGQGDVVIWNSLLKKGRSLYTRYSLVVEPTPLKHISQNWDHFPKYGWKTYTWNRHLVFYLYSACWKTPHVSVASVSIAEELTCPHQAVCSKGPVRLHKFRFMHRRMYSRGKCNRMSQEVVNPIYPIYKLFITHWSEHHWS